MKVQRTELFNAKFKTKDKAQAELIQAAIDALKTTQKETKDAKKAIEKTIRETKSGIKKLKAEQKKAAKKTEKLQKAKAKIDAEVKTMSTELATWLAQRAAIDAANKVVETAAETFGAARDKLESEYEPKLKKAKEKVKSLEARAFPDSIVPVWNGRSPTAAASSLPIKIGKNSRLEGYTAQIEKTMNAYRSGLSGLSAEERKVYEDDLESWATSIQDMSDQLTFCAQLKASTTRLIKLHEAMQKARTRAGD